MIQELTLPEIATPDKHSMKRGPFGGALKKNMFVENGYVVYEQQHAIYKRFNDVRYYIDESKYKEMKAFKVEEGDLIISCSGTIGKIAEIPKNFKPGIINQALLKLTLDQNKVLNKYFIFLFESTVTQNHLFNLSHGTGLKNFPPMSVVKSIKFPLPPLDQQKKIADILDAADAYRKKTKALIEKYDELTQSLFLDMFGDPVTNPKGFEKSALGSCIEKVNKIGKSYSKDNIQYLDIGSIDNIRNITTETTFFNTIERPSRAQQILLSGDIIFSTVRPNLKNIAINFIDGRIGSTGFFICRTNSDIIINFFLFRLLLTDTVTEYFVGITSGANYPAINSSDIKKFQVIIPPLELQNQFAERVQAIEAQKAQAEASLAQAEDLFNSLLQRAFKGELTN